MGSWIAYLQEQPTLAGALAILAAALASVMTFLSPSERSASHHSAGTKFNSLRNRVRVFREIDLAVDSGTNGYAEQVKQLGAERDDLNEASPQIPRGAFKRARKAIEAGEARYEIDKK